MAGALRARLAETAGSGPESLAWAMADVATALWGRALRFDATAPGWADRDRFVLSAGHGSELLYAALHLTGHTGMEADALPGGAGSDCPARGHAAYGAHPAIEAMAGEPGQGLGMAVGMALAERMMAARFGRSLVDHRTWAMACRDDLAQGVSYEAAAIAGRLRLERLAVLLDDGDGEADGGGETLKWFAAAGWATRAVDGRDPAAVAGALGAAARSRRPTLLAFRTKGRRLEAGEAGDDGAEGLWRRAGVRGVQARRAWRRRLANHPLREPFERVTAGRLPAGWHEATAALKTELAAWSPALSPRQGAARAAAALAEALPELTQGDAGQDMARQGAPGPEGYGGRTVGFGGRAQGMAACLNGMALHGGLSPVGLARMAATDGMQAGLRLAALMRRRVVYVLRHDEFGAGLEAAEHLASLRAMPGTLTLRPADALEAVECWELAIGRRDGPSLLVLSDWAGPSARTDGRGNRCALGGYLLAEADGARATTLIASGAEVAVAMEARRMLAAAGIAAAVVSLPCWELFAAQDAGYRARVLGDGLRIGIELGRGFGWERWLGDEGVFVRVPELRASGAEAAPHRRLDAAAAAAVAAWRRLRPGLKPPPFVSRA